MADRLRLGVVGANPEIGWANRTHMPALLALPEYELGAVCTTKQESAEASKQKYEADKAYWNFRDLMADQDVDVVDVCVRVPYHHEIVIAALEAGKHVYCEWPLAATVEQAEEIDALARKTGVHTMVGLQARGAPSIIRLHDLIHQGWVGDVVTATMSQFQGGSLQERSPDMVWRGDRKNGANTVTITGGHSLDAFNWCVGPLTEVAGVLDTLAPEWKLQGGGTMQATAPDHVSMTGRLRGGGVAILGIGSVPFHGSPFQMAVYGTKGSLVATASQNLQATGVKLQGGQGRGDLADMEVPADLRWVPAEVPDGTPVNVAQMMRRFAEGIREGSHPEPTFADAVRNHRLLDAVERSMLTRTAVQISS